ESGELCLMSGLLGDNRDIFFPKLREQLDLVRFSDIAVRYLHCFGFEPHECASEDEARDRAAELIARKQWPVYFFASDTTGEKDFEEFYTDAETLDMQRFDAIGVIKNEPVIDEARLEHFLQRITEIRAGSTWDKPEIVELFNYMIPDFRHKETGKYLDGRM
ncbi:MAG TPA: UDP-N-acetylglucosamine 4,6-dehydratase, partial [Halieaceae bacterium]|nr:UDP-N-acetylglucosamine 4,6-dehydratase [Halieaceae bacterium]